MEAHCVREKLGDAQKEKKKLGGGCFKILKPDI
jgi:hypothetical protein